MLFVDDDRSLLAALERALHRQPYQCLFADDPRRAFELLASEPVAVVVADERMPGMSGTELLARIREPHPGAVGILLTGHFSGDVALRAINEARVMRVLQKPCDLPELSSAIRAALRATAGRSTDAGGAISIRPRTDLFELLWEAERQLGGTRGLLEPRARAIWRRLHRHVDAVERLVQAFRRP